MPWYALKSRTCAGAVKHAKHVKHAERRALRSCGATAAQRVAIGRTLERDGGSSAHIVVDVSDAAEAVEACALARDLCHGQGDGGGSQREGVHRAELGSAQAPEVAGVNVNPTHPRASPMTAPQPGLGVDE